MIMNIGCGERTEILPSEVLPFEYQLTLSALSSSCLDSDQAVEQREFVGTLEIGEQGDLVLVEMKAAHIDWKFFGLICLDEETNEPKSLCLGLRSSQILMSIPHVSDLDERLLCEQWTSSPSTLPELSPSDRSPIRPNDREWREHFESCCQFDEVDEYVTRLSLNHTKTIGGEISVKHELNVRAQNVNGPPLSWAERQGAIALCGPPHSEVTEERLSSCVERFILNAEAK